MNATLFSFFQRTKNKSNVDLAGIIFLTRLSDSAIQHSWFHVWLSQHNHKVGHFYKDIHELHLFFPRACRNSLIFKSFSLFFSNRSLVKESHHPCRLVPLRLLRSLPFPYELMLWLWFEGFSQITSVNSVKSCIFHKVCRLTLWLICFPSHYNIWC